MNAAARQASRRLPVLAVALSMLAVATLVVVMATGRDDGDGGLTRIEIRGDRFVESSTNDPFFVLGLNYVGDSGRLVGELWDSDPDVVRADLAEIRALGANTVYLHLQITDHMTGPATHDPESFERLRSLIDEAASHELRVVVVGLGAYRVGGEPGWLDELDEASRIEVFADFWRETARALVDEPAVLFYDLINAPRVPGEPKPGWYIGALESVQFHQWLTLDPGGRDPDEIGREWVAIMVEAVRTHDPDRPITIGTAGIPGTPFALTSASVHQQLDLVSPHMYPTSGQIPLSIRRVAEFDVGKPVVIAETFPLQSTWQEWEWFLLDARPHLAGVVGQYDGRSRTELEALGGWSPWLDSARVFAALAAELPTDARVEPLRHFLHPATGVHRYVRHHEEISRAAGEMEDQGAEGALLSSNDGDAAALCRFADPRTGDEVLVLGCRGPDGYRLERAVGWAYEQARSGTTPLHGYRNAAGTRHLYTVTRDDARYERDALVHMGVIAHLPSAPPPDHRQRSARPRASSPRLHASLRPAP